jgi:hypothetical protein
MDLNGVKRICIREEEEVQDEDTFLSGFSFQNLIPEEILFYFFLG